MTARVRWAAWILGVALVAIAPTTVAAQMVHPTRLPADDPRARRAGEVVERLLTGEMAQVQGYLAEHGAVGYGGTPTVAAESAPLMEMMGGRMLEVEGYMAAMERSVIVLLRDPAGEQVLVLVGLEATPPFRVTKLATAEFRSP
jgi:hypothetical protein